MTKQYSIVYCAPKLEPFLSLDKSDPLLFEKELIYEGAFIKRKGAPDGTDLSFKVDETTLKYWKDTGESMLANGVEIPMPTMHTDDPEKKRANITGYRLGINKEGKKALYGISKFVDAEAAKLAASADVSIFVPLEAHDGKGNTYKTPIRHVAFTNYPVIPGLEKFQAIAASFDTGDKSMPSALLPIAQQIGVQASDQMDDAQLTNAIVLAFNDLKKKVDDKSKQPPPVTLPQPIAFAFTNMLKENRISKIDNLLKEGNIVKISRDELVAELCSDKTLALSLSMDANGSPVTDSSSFERIINALKHNKVVGYDERTGMQIPDALALAHDIAKKQEESDIVKAAEKRAKAANQK